MTEQIFLILCLFSIFIIAGMIKGAAGLGLPTTAMGLMTISIAPRTLGPSHSHDSCTTRQRRST